MPGPDRLGVIGTVLVGVAGANVGGLIGAVSGSASVIGFDFRSFLMAVIARWRSSSVTELSPCARWHKSVMQGSREE